MSEPEFLRCRQFQHCSLKGVSARVFKVSSVPLKVSVPEFLRCRQFQHCSLKDVRARVFKKVVKENRPVFKSGRRGKHVISPSSQHPPRHRMCVIMSQTGPGDDGVPKIGE
ncbi:hypothetical protein ACOMHN_032202 [Nucella lapillus]